MISRQDLIDRFGEEEIARLTDHEHYQTINEVVLGRALADAVAEVNSYLAPVGLVGIDPPKALVIKACDIARYYLYENGVTPIVEARYKQALAWLKEVMRHPQMLDPNAESDNQSHDMVSGISVQGNDSPDYWWRDAY